MLKNISILSVAISAVLFSCNTTSTSSNVNIDGTVENAENTTIYLQKYVDSLKIFSVVDSVEMTDNTFHFETYVDSMEFVLIAHKTIPPIELIVQKDEKITLSYDMQSIPQSISIKGSEHSEINTSIYQFVANFEEIKNRFSTKLNDLEYTDTTGRQNILKDFEVERSKFQQEKAMLFSENSASPATHVFLPYLSPENELKYFQEIERAFAKNLNNTVWHNSVKRKLEEVENYILQQERYKKQQEAIENSGPGKSAPEISLTDPKGNIRNLSDLKGKIVLIDFWASWCRPCRAENPNVVRLYNKYKNKGFDIFSVSLDQQLGKWENAIAQDGLIWENHVSDLLGWNTSVTSLYGFSGIPYTVLIDKEGNIIASKLRGPSLEAKLKEIFGS